MSVRNHFFSAALIWCIVGVFLMRYGIKGMIVSGQIWLVIFALILGMVKSILVLDKAARSNVSRIQQFERKSGFWNVFSGRMWLLIVFMAVCGRILRTSSVPPEILWVLYSAVGCALLFSSRLFWQSWRS